MHFIEISINLTTNNDNDIINGTFQYTINGDGQKIKFKGKKNLDKYMKLYEQIHRKIN